MERHYSPEEIRYPTNDEVRVVIMRFQERLAGKIINVSSSGLRLELPTQLPIQTSVEILTAGGVAIFGEIRHCWPADALFHADVRIDDTIFMPLGEHIAEDALSLHASGHGLTAHEFLRMKAHLEHCTQCRSALAEVSEFQLLGLRGEKNFLDEAVSSLEDYVAKFKRQT